MKAYEIVGHCYEGLILCPDCSIYDKDLEDEPEDSNGEPVYPIFADSEDAFDWCVECGVNLLTGNFDKRKEE